LFTPSSVSAAGYGLSVYPPLLRVHIKPGKSITQVFKIDNLTSDDKFFVARLIPFSDSDTLGNPKIDLRATAPWLSYFSLANSNIKFGDPFLIKGGSSEQLIVNLSAPENAPVRDIYGSLLISTYANINGIDYQGSLVSATVGSNLLITISQEANPPTLLRVEDISPESGSVIKIGNYYIADNITPLSFRANALNLGDFTAETKGIFKVTGRSDQPIHLEGILPINVISKTKRALLNSEGGKFTFTPDLGRLGIYQVTVSIKTDNANAENSINLILFPFKILIGLIFATAFLVTIVRTTKYKVVDIDSETQQ
ncbi:MAG: hypothetical protein UW68_C0025G0008, partial [Candidatus Collierbacteria bacterium GW2011_GWB1_44_6]